MRNLAAIAVLVAACGGKDAKPAGAAAGEVVRVEGSVTATRAGKGTQPRVLAVAAEVFADDTVVTAGGASVDIVLAHNEAVWKLGPGETRRVDESAAWRAPKGSGEASTFATADEDRTASAGRHTDIAFDEGETGKRPAKKGEGGMRGGNGGGPSNIGGDFRDGVITQHSGGPGGGLGLRGTAPTLVTEMGEATADGPLDKHVIRRVMRSRFPAMRRCYEHELEDDPKFEVELAVVFTVETSGRLSPITVDPEPTPRFTACLKGAMRAVQMPEADAETEVRLPLTFRKK